MSYVCDICGKEFGFPSALRMHEAIHLPYQDRAFVCPHSGCHKRFSDALGLSVHHRVHLSERSQFPCGFPNCHKTFLQKRSAAKHRAQAHGLLASVSPGSERKIDSEALGYVDQSASLPSKGGATPTEASVASLPSSPPDSLVVAEDDALAAVSTAQPAQAINEAGASIAVTVESSAEVAASEAGLVKCLECGKVFQSSAWLRVHSRWHRGLPPYECSFCPGAFSSAHKLKRHRISAHAHNYPSSSLPSPEKAANARINTTQTSISFGGNDDEMDDNDSPNILNGQTTLSSNDGNVNISSMSDGASVGKRPPSHQTLLALRLKAAIQEMRTLYRCAAQASVSAESPPSSSPNLTSSSSPSSFSSSTSSSSSSSNYKSPRSVVLDANALACCITMGDDDSFAASSSSDDEGGAQRLWDAVFSQVGEASSRSGTSSCNGGERLALSPPSSKRKAQGPIGHESPPPPPRTRHLLKFAGVKVGSSVVEEGEGSGVGTQTQEWSSLLTAASPPPALGPPRSAKMTTASVSSGTDPLDTLFLLLGGGCGVGGGGGGNSLTIETMTEATATPTTALTTIAVGTDAPLCSTTVSHVNDEVGNNYGNPDLLTKARQVSAGTSTDDDSVFATAYNDGLNRHCRAASCNGFGERGVGCESLLSLVGGGGGVCGGAMTMSTGTDPIDFSIMLALDGCSSPLKGYVDTGTDPVDFELDDLLT